MPRRKTGLIRVNRSSVDLARDLEVLDERVKHLVEIAAAESTRKAYAADMRQFEIWCKERGARYLPATERVVSLYLAELDRNGLRPSTIGRKLAAIVRTHRARGHDSPRTALITEQMKGIHRGEAGRRPAPPKEAPPITSVELALLVEAMDAAPATHQELATRDKAALLVGWACAMRRSEIVGLDIADTELVREGWKIWIRRSKTDQEGAGIALALAPAEKNLLLCPVVALEDWLEVRRGDAAKQPPGPLFWKSCEQRGHCTTLPELLPGVPMPWQQMNRLIARWCRRAGLLEEGVPFSPHSLRAGFITEAIQSGRPIPATKERSRHASTDVFFKYVRTAMTFESNVQKGLL